MYSVVWLPRFLFAAAVTSLTQSEVFWPLVALILPTVISAAVCYMLGRIFGRRADVPATLAIGVSAPLVLNAATQLLLPNIYARAFGTVGYLACAVALLAGFFLQRRSLLSHGSGASPDGQTAAPG
jgi:hypothetical protein